MLGAYNIVNSASQVITSWNEFAPLGFAPFATAAACIGPVDAGFANVNLTGTPYKLVTSDFGLTGNGAVGGVKVVSDQVVNLHAGGSCGFAGPIYSTDYSQSPVTSSPPSERYMRLAAVRCRPRRRR